MHAGGHSGFVNAPNVFLANGFTVPGYACPSSTVRPFSWNNTTRMRTSFTGTAGASSVTGATNKAPFNVGSAQACCNGPRAFASGNGLLYSGSKANMRDCTDGTSNTFIVHEETDYLHDANNGVVSVASGGKDSLNSSGIYGWTMGAAVGVGQQPSARGDGRHFNCATVRYGVNARGLRTTRAR